MHEGTLVTALNMMSLWCARFYTNVPDKLIEWFKVALEYHYSFMNKNCARIKVILIDKNLF